MLTMVIMILTTDRVLQSLKVSGQPKSLASDASVSYWPETEERTLGECEYHESKGFGEFVHCPEGTFIYAITTINLPRGDLVKLECCNY